MKNITRIVLRTLISITGLLLIYSGFSLIFSSSMEIKEMMMIAKVKPLIPLPFVFMELAFLYNGILEFLIGLYPFIAEYLKKKNVITIILRLLSIFFAIVMINPMILEIHFIVVGKVNFMALATAPGLFFPGGLFVHVFIEHWFGGILGFSIGVYPKVFSSLSKVVRKLKT
ncbi:hypothetical protein SJAV_25500 [Sulfurisphaera javensis]|uniref:Uncharacterized protein n=2 Tax=Sulfurisphaera javensis TaxID=2049879 RepID=A0AAT9GVD6_9CREN